MQAAIATQTSSRDALNRLVCGREHGLFEAAMENCRELLTAEIAGKSLLVLGGAGSIGSEVVRLLSEYEPARLHVVDISENSLVELVRDLRSRGAVSGELLTYPVDFGADYFRDFLNESGPYDAILSFAAIKHVRSEKDPYSLSRMLQENIVKPYRFFSHAAESGMAASIFSVSTDKAANPVSLMGCSKRMMEHALFSAAARGPVSVRSARFANVAFSSGSLLESFLFRLSSQQPLAAPSGIARYLISPREAAELSVLSAFAISSGNIGIPALDPDSDLIPMDRIAEIVLREHGYEPHIVHSEAEARAFELDGKRWPLLLTNPDTPGEKSYEEFVGADESSHDSNLSNICRVPYVPVDMDLFEGSIERIEAVVHGKAPRTKQAFIDILSEVVPRFAHVASDNSLDQRM